MLGRFIRVILAVLATAVLVQSTAADEADTIECSLIMDAGSGAILKRDGACDLAVTPMSTFKLPLAIIGYDTGILVDETTPRWPYRAEYKAPKRNRKPVDPTIWETESVLWYSQVLTRRMGREAFAAGMAKLAYGNGDIGGLPGGEDGLTHSWLMSSLLISADQQADFVRRFINRQLPVAGRAIDMTRNIIPVFEAADGWTIHGKTGSGWMRDAQGKIDRKKTLGWFVGWAEKDDRRIVFARMRIGAKKGTLPAGLELRAGFIASLPQQMAKR